MGVTGGCHCGAVRYEAKGDPVVHALCHCADCRRSAGAPMVGWTMFPADTVSSTGDLTTYESSEHGRRQFCPRCGTGLFYTNAQNLPGIVDIQSATFDDPEAIPPQAHVQVADRIGWMTEVDRLPQFERYPPQD